MLYRARTTYAAGVLGSLLLFAAPHTAHAQFSNSLWLGTDNTDALMVLNTDRSGTLLRSTGPVEATGIAIDASHNTIYFASSGGNITPYDLPTLTPGVSFNPPGQTFGEDMAFDGTSLWRVDISASTILKINPTTHVIDASFVAPFSPLGIAWDGSDLWISEFADGGRVEKFTTAGVDTGTGFNIDAGTVAGGLAFDTTDSTLYLGTFGSVLHYTLGGVQLGSFNVPTGDNRFVDGLEFEGASAVPEPGSVALLVGMGVSGAGFLLRKRRRTVTLA